MPTTAPTSICKANSWRPASTGEAPVPPAAVPAASRLTRSAIPTGSLAPDSPSRIVPDRPEISRRPSTEKTTPGPVGDKAAPRRLEKVPAISTAATTRTRIEKANWSDTTLPDVSDEIADQTSRHSVSLNVQARDGRSPPSSLYIQRRGVPG